MGIAKQLKLLNLDKTTCPDEVPGCVLKETANQIAPLITISSNNHTPQENCYLTDPKHLSHKSLRKEKSPIPKIILKFHHGIQYGLMFDHVRHERLLSKLEYYGIHRQTRNWIASLLHNHTQTVSVNGALSDEASVTSDVPQG